MNSVIITGAAGFIGCHLVKYLAAKGMEVYGIVRGGNKALPAMFHTTTNIHIVQGDIAAYQTLVQRLPQGPAAVFHLAWAGVAPAERHSTELQVENVQVSLDAVRLAHAVSAERFILPGSTMEYAYCGQKINANALPSPQNAYGAAKLSVRYLCESLCKELSVPFIYTVLSGIYSADRTDNNVIYYAISELLKGRRPSFTRLEQKWDYIHLNDLLEALYLISFKGKTGAFYTIGRGDNCPLSDYIYLIRDLIDPKLPLGIGDIPYKDSRLPSSCVDITQLCADTGFVPKIAFQDGIREVIEQIRQTKI